MIKIKITFLGTGAAFHNEIGNTSALLEFDDTNLLIDCGYTVPSRLENLGYEAKDIENIFITHMHGDHVGGLEELLFKQVFKYGQPYSKLIAEERIVGSLFDYLKHTMHHTLTGTRRIGSYFNGLYDFEGSCYFRLNDKTFSALRVGHIPSKASYMLKCEDIFTYTGDVGNRINTDLDSDYIFHDVKLITEDEMDETSRQAHMPLPRILEYPDSFKENIYLMHYNDRINEFKDIIKEHGMQVVKSYQTIKM